MLTLATPWLLLKFSIMEVEKKNLIQTLFHRFLSIFVIGQTTSITC